MADSATIACPHCAAANGAASEFCASCGMALPSLNPSGPRILTSKGVAQTSAGQILQSSELLNTARQAARSLLSIGVINLGFGALNIFIVYNAYGGNLSRVSLYFEAITASMTVAGALYVGMYFWAKYSPLAATIVGLAVYLAKWVVDITIHATLMTHASSGTSYANYSFVRIIMVIYLIRGVAAGWRHRKLEQQQREQSQPISVLPIQ